ncbi:MAG: single-stranded DNA-binding protein [Bacteroidales bacterium]|nr:single-stranded DNA-binding protein [Bacteroidales bacterium]
MALNKVMLIGNVGQDPEVRYLEGNSGNKVATIRLATTERYRDRGGELREITEWHTVVAWRGLADLAERYIRKGSQIYVEGRLRTRSWEDQSNNKRYVTEVLADNIQLLGRKSDGQGPQQGGYQSGGSYRAPQQGGYQPSGTYQAPQGGGYQAQQPHGGYQAQSQPASYAPQPAQPMQPEPQVPPAEEEDDLPF